MVERGEDIFSELPQKRGSWNYHGASLSLPLVLLMNVPQHLLDSSLEWG
jgi:hypothetical protein